MLANTLYTVEQPPASRLWETFLRALLKPERPEPLPSHALWHYEDAALPFTPGRWNDARTRRLSNCYSYALDLPIEKLFDFAPQPGQTGLPFWKYVLSQFLVTKKTLTEAAAADGLIPHHLARPVPAGYRLVALMYRPGVVFGDYHWYRLDRDGNGTYVWTHKPGSGHTTDRDRSGNVIYNLSTADLGIFKPRWGGYFLAPTKPKNIP